MTSKVCVLGSINMDVVVRVAKLAIAFPPRLAAGSTKESQETLVF